MLKLKQMIAVGVLAIALILGVAAYAIFKTPAEASGPIQAIPLAESATESATSTLPTQSAASSSGATAITAAATTEPPVADAQSTPAATASDDSASSSSLVLQLDQAESKAQFIIDEVLDNAPKTVIGSTDQVAGEIAIDPQDPTKTRVGIIQVNARTLTTDNDFRNRAIKNQILQTDQYEMVTFTPTEIVGLPETGAVGESYTFQIVGDLTIRDMTKQATFDVTVTAPSDTRVEGTATTTIAYADYGISIPQVRQVASVSDQVRLELDFVAVA
jgi:polyisoprenoid-binding protein YceI